MNKDELIDAISARTRMTKADSRKAVDAMVTVLCSSLRFGYPVELPGFGSLEVHLHKARSWRGRSGRTITIPAHKTAFLNAAAELKELINSR